MAPSGEVQYIDKQPQVSDGSFKPSVYTPSPEDIARARAELERIKNEKGWLEPDRGNLDAPGIDWREGKPDYTIANLAYFRGKSKNHPPGSLKLVVENLVKTWEMEASHKPFSQWGTVAHDKYAVNANGGKAFHGQEAASRGNYNVLLSACPRELYDAEAETFESSHAHFRGAFPGGFPWEVLEVYSGPPKVGFSWRHWATFSGEYEGNQGAGETVNMTGFAVVTLEDMKVTTIEVYYDPVLFLQVIKGLKKVDELPAHGIAHGPALLSEAEGGCPFMGGAKKAEAAA